MGRLRGDVLRIVNVPKQSSERSGIGRGRMRQYNIQRCSGKCLVDAERSYDEIWDLPNDYTRRYMDASTGITAIGRDSQGRGVAARRQREA